MRVLVEVLIEVENKITQFAVVTEFFFLLILTFTPESEFDRSPGPSWPASRLGMKAHIGYRAH